MSTEAKLAVLFPGQGAFYAGALSKARREFPRISEILSEVDDVASRHYGMTLSEVLFAATPEDIGPLMERSPAVLNLAIYGVSVATYAVLESNGVKPDVLVGHSFGEIAALVCGGAFTVREGAELIHHRCAALERLGARSGSMAALTASPQRVAGLITLVGREELAIAVENGPHQVVIAGSQDAMEQALAATHAMGIPAVRLQSPYPFHVPAIMGPVAEDFAARIRHLRPASLKVPVFSPIAGRAYTDADNLTAWLAEHLKRPVRFSAAVAQLAAEGVTTFLESGARSALSTLVQGILKDSAARAVACLPAAADEVRALQDALRLARGEASLSPEALVGQLLGLEAPEATLGAFWKAHAPQVRSQARQLFEAWRAASVPVAAPAPVPVPAPALEKAPAPVPRAQLLSELVSLFAEALEYPEEVLTEQVDLEAELGIDSVKQMELLARIEKQYKLPPRPESFRLSDYRTLGQVADMVLSVKAGHAHA